MAKKEFYIWNLQDLQNFQGYCYLNNVKHYRSESTVFKKYQKRSKFGLLAEIRHFGYRYLSRIAFRKNCDIIFLSKFFRKTYYLAYNFEKTCHITVSILFHSNAFLRNFREKCSPFKDHFQIVSDIFVNLVNKYIFAKI